MTTHTLLDAPLTGNAVLVTGLHRHDVANFYALESDALIVARLDTSRPHFHATLASDGTFGGYLAAVEFATRQPVSDDTPQTLILHDIDDAFAIASRAGWGPWLVAALAGIAADARKRGNRLVLVAERAHHIPGAVVDLLARVHAGPPVGHGCLSVIPAAIRGGEGVIAQAPEAVKPTSMPPSVYPSVTGEDLVLRFTRSTTAATLDALVFTAADGKPLEWLLETP